MDKKHELHKYVGENIICLRCLRPVDAVYYGQIENLRTYGWVFCHGRGTFVMLELGALFDSHKQGVFTYPHESGGLSQEQIMKEIGAQING
jgi:hypothetical protein